ncbi:hypothetical protein GCM10009527_031970 [Actinomadura nitritigenes]|uniref:Ferredoxin n=1 Tax=Actinomadura nitritigenes TaxID=134602 RepID=A0ABS3QVA5_9ACTN|nr:ferredoxin [Actinomadura nitritigenes]MBO2437542.1 ferredoxin [Actinomadura nitritigenes]
MTWLIEVDGRTCIGSGICAGTAPGHFAVVDGTSRPVRDEAEPDDRALDAAESCPVEAITIRAEGTGEVLAPQE